MRVTFVITSESATILASAKRVISLAYRKLQSSPSRRRKVSNGPRPAKRAAAEATLRALDSL